MCWEPVDKPTETNNLQKPVWELRDIWHEADNRRVADNLSLIVKGNQCSWCEFLFTDAASLWFSPSTYLRFSHWLTSASLASVQPRLIPSLWNYHPGLQLQKQRQLWSVHLYQTPLVIVSYILYQSESYLSVSTWTQLLSDLRGLGPKVSLLDLDLDQLLRCGQVSDLILNLIKYFRLVLNVGLWTGPGLEFVLALIKLGLNLPSGAGLTHLCWGFCCSWLGLKLTLKTAWICFFTGFLYLWPVFNGVHYVLYLAQILSHRWRGLNSNLTPTWTWLVSHGLDHFSVE